VTAARVLVLALLLSAVAVYLGPYRERQQDEAELARIASVIAGRGVGVECPGVFGTLTDVSSRDGSVEFDPDGRPADATKLSDSTCDRLRRFLAGDVAGLGCLALADRCPKAAEHAAVAVNVLSHEAWHLRGVRDEAAAQCYALQTNADTALQLGASADEARAIAAFVNRRIQPALPAEYRTADCRNGGRLDLHPERAAWP
jgi:hypothetical protein